MPKLSNCKILVGKILTVQHAPVKFVRLFHHQSFTLYGSYNYYKKRCKEDNNLEVYTLVEGCIFSTETIVMAQNDLWIIKTITE